MLVGTFGVDTMTDYGFVFCQFCGKRLLDERFVSTYHTADFEFCSKDCQENFDKYCTGNYKAEKIQEIIKRINNEK